MSLCPARRAPERGAVVVEFALVVPILVVLVLGMIEMGFLMKDAVSLSSTVRAGARTASAAPGAGPGTCEASQNPPPCSPQQVPAFAQAAANSMQNSGSSIPAGDIEWAMIFEPNADGYPIGSSDLTCGGTNCVVYVWDEGLQKFRYSSGRWASASVNACLNDPQRDSVGVAMKIRHHWMSGLFGDSMDMSEKAIMQFEPLEADRCKPGTPNAHQ